MLCLQDKDVDIQAKVTDYSRAICHVCQVYVLVKFKLLLQFAFYSVSGSIWV